MVGGRFTLTAEMSGMFSGSNLRGKVLEGATGAAGDGLALTGAWVGLALTGKEVGVGLGANVVGTGWGAAVVAGTAPDGALLLLREICWPPWTFC